MGVTSGTADVELLSYLSGLSRTNAACGTTSAVIPQERALRTSVGIHLCAAPLALPDSDERGSRTQSSLSRRTIAAIAAAMPVFAKTANNSRG